MHSYSIAISYRIANNRTVIIEMQRSKLVVYLIMKHSALVCTIIFLLSACNGNRPKAIHFPVGGYSYPKEIDAKDSSFYIYPIKDSLSHKDSFEMTTYLEEVFTSYEEPNLSLRPPTQPVFRLVFQPSWYIAILTLQEGKLLVKDIQTGYPLADFDERRLDTVEQDHLNLLRMHYPIDQFKGRSYQKAYLDSLVSVYPQLLEAAYYRQLTDKASEYGTEPFTYRTRELPLTKAQYNHFVRLINESGYWKLKPVEFNCIGESTHAGVYYLEAATPTKYNMVAYMICNEDSSKMAKAVNELIRFAKLDQYEKEWFEKQLKVIDSLRNLRNN